MNYHKIEELITRYPIYQYAFMKVDDIEFNDKVRTICKKECSRYGTSWSCPPAVGTVEACQERCRKYTDAVLFSTVCEVPDYSDFSKTLEGRREHEALTAKVEKALRDQGYLCYTLSTESCSICDKCTYPKASCRHPEHMHPCIESQGILITKTIEENAMDFFMGEQYVIWFTLILLKES